MALAHSLWLIRIYNPNVKGLQDFKSAFQKLPGYKPGRAKAEF
jgi:hypothetical protein